MSLTRTIAHQTILQISAKALSVLLGVFTVGVLARYLGQEGYGNYTTAISFVFFFVVIADLGLYFVTITELGRPDTDACKFFSNVFTIRLCAAIIAMSAAAIMVWVFPYPTIVKHGVMIITVSTLANLLDQLHIALFQKNLKMHWAAIAEVAGKLAILIGSVIAVRSRMSLTGLLWIVVAGYVLHFIIDMIGARRLIKYTLAFDLHLWKRILMRAWPIAFSGFFVMIYFKMDTILLSLLRPAESAQREVGVYGAAYKVLEVLITFPSLFLGLMIPHLTHAFATDDRSRFARVFQKSFDFFSLVTFPLLVVFFTCAAPIIIVVAGPDFEVSAPVLKVLILAVGVIYLTHLPVYAIAATEQQRTMMWHYIIGAVGSLIAYAFTIPRYSYYGAAWTTVAVECYIGIAAFWLIRKKMNLRLSGEVFWKSAGAGATMAVVIVVLNLNLWASIAVGGAVYATALLLTGAVTRAQIRDIMRTH